MRQSLRRVQRSSITKIALRVSIDDEYLGDEEIEG